MKEHKEKNWKNMYLRKEKLHRAKQLGFEYPISRDILKLNESINVLFVCSRNKWRSPTAEWIYKKRAMVNARSAGTSNSAKRKITSDDIKWADIILVMEDKHKNKIQSEFPGETKFKEIHVLNIPDEYKYMDEDLIEEITILSDPIIYNRKSAQQVDAPEPATMVSPALQTPHRPAR